MTLVGQRGVQCPEHLDDPHGGLGNRLGQVAARRGHGAHCRQAAPALVGADALHAAGTLVELSQTGGQIRGVAFLAGHLTEGLGPAGGRVCDNGHIIAHVAEVLRDGDTGIHRRLTGGHGHIGGVGDQHRPLHQAFAGAGVLQLREFPQNVGHLVAALAAADVNHDVHIGPLGQLVLHHGLAGAEGAGDCRRAALGDGEHGVDDPLTGAQRPLGRILLRIGTAHTDGPLLEHGEGDFPAVLGLEGGDGLRHVEGAALDGGDGAAHGGRHHDLMEHNGRLLNCAQNVAADDLIAHLGHRVELPLLLVVHGGDLHAAGDAGTHLLHDLLQRTLDSVINALDHAGAKLHAHRRAGGLHLGAGAQTRGLLIDLDVGGVTLHGQDLTDQALGADTDHVGHIGVRQTRSHHQRPGNFNNFTAQIR